MKGKVKQWTIMMFMTANNDLSRHGERDLEKAKALGSTGAVDVVAELDDTGDITRRFHLRHGTALDDDTRVRLSETNSGNPRTITQFAKWSRKHYPSQRRMLVISGHGSALHGEPSVRPKESALLRIWRRITALFTGPRAAESGGLVDLHSADVLTLGELKREAKAISDNGGKLDILAVEACMMNTIELSYQLRESVQIIVASQDQILDPNWPYDWLVFDFNVSPTASTEQLARKIVETTAACDRKQQVTLAAVRVDEAGIVAAAVSRLADALVFGIQQKAVLDQVVLAHYTAQAFREEGVIDLVDFCEQLLSRSMPPVVHDACRAVIAAVNGFVIVSQTVSRAAARAHGVSIHLSKGPVSNSYRSLDFAKDTRWLQFIDAYVEARRAGAKAPPSTPPWGSTKNTPAQPRVAA